MKEINGEMFGVCTLCGIIGQGKNDFVCLDCGTPDKLMLVCRCGRRKDLTSLIWGKFSEYLKAIIPWSEQDEKYLRPGITIFVGKCIFCGGQEALEKEAGKDLRIYTIRNQGFNVNA